MYNIFYFIYFVVENDFLLNLKFSSAIPLCAIFPVYHCLAVKVIARMAVSKCVRMEVLQQIYL